MNYAIEYEHLKDELITSGEIEWHFDNVKNNANKHRLELSDEDFKRLLKLQIAGEDIGWLMHKMSIYRIPLPDVLVSYITFK